MLRQVSVSSAKVFLALLALFVLSAQGKSQRVWAAADIPPSQSLFDFTHSKPGGRMILAAADKGDHLALNPPDKEWDISRYTRLELDVRNPGKTTVHLRVRALNKGGTDWGQSALNDGFIRPGQRKHFNVFLYRTWETRDQYPDLKLFTGMSGLPGGLMSHWHTIDAAHVISLELGLDAAPKPQRLEVFTISATHPIVPARLRNNPKGFFPFVDRYGQYKYEDWPGKIHSDAELKAAAQSERKDLATHPVSPEWDRWGGWKNGPKVTATGAFRTQKWQGKWWLVDPDGRLFWSHGPNSVGYESGRTPVTGRENYFQGLPPRKGDLAFAWSQTKSDQPWYFDFVTANMRRRFGPDWEAISQTLTHQRLHSWGMNTIGNWSSDKISAMHKTPYTVSLWPWSPTLSGDTNWDVFRPDFKANFRQGIKGGVAATARDPWCIGYFVHNEMGWCGSALGFMSSVLAADPQAATKKAFVEFLQKRDPDIAVFNTKTGKSFQSWDAVLANRESVPLDKLQPEADAFYERYCDLYFLTCRAALREYAPGRLYLGARFNVSNPISIRSAARGCDVLSFNIYQSDVNNFRPGDQDKPALISEFHFGSLDRGYFSTGLQPASDSQDRADKYAYYVRGAMKNPYIVGAHWFAYCPQAITGRGDNENGETGLFDICNSPYPDLRQALRDVGYRMYAIRSAK